MDAPSRVESFALYHSTYHNVITHLSYFSISILRKTSLNAVGVSVLSLAPNAVVLIKDATSWNNFEYGYRLRGATIHVKDSTAKHNVQGIRIAGERKRSPTNVQFKGEVFSYGNVNDGIVIGEGFGPGNNAFAMVIVEGNLISFRNKYNGLLLEDFQSQGSEDFVVKKNGSFISCQNGEADIYYEDDVNFVDGDSDGIGYTCESIDSPTPGTPVCVPCPVCA